MNKLTNRHINLIRLIISFAGLLLAVLALLVEASKLELILAGLALLLTGWLFRWAASAHRLVATILLNTILLFLLIEIASTTMLAITTVPFVKSMLAGITGTPNDLVAHYQSLPYYTEQDWSAQYWQEFEQALKKRYHPYVIWRSPPFSGLTLNIDQDGVRVTPSAQCSQDAYTVFVFGGSAMWGWGAPDWATIPAFLQSGFEKVYDKPVCVVNFAENAYVSTQNLIQLVLLLEAGNVPDLVIFYDGVNDVLAASQTGQPIVHQNLTEIAKLFQEREPPWLAWLHNLNSFRLLQMSMQQLGAFDTPGNPKYGPDTVQLTASVTQAYLSNYTVVGSLAQTYGFEYYFFWQPHILVGDKPLTEQERDMITGLDWVLKMDSTLVDLFTGTYEGIKYVAPEYENLYSLSHVFDDVDRQMWMDTWGHVTPDGNKLIADEMLEIIAAD